MFTFSKSRYKHCGYRGVIAAGQGDLDQQLSNFDGGAAPLSLDGDVSDSLQAATHAPGDGRMTCNT